MENNKPTKGQVRNSRLFLVAVFIIPIVAFIVYSIIKSDSNSYDEMIDGTKMIQSNTVSYEVTGTGIASVTFEAESGSRQLAGVLLPWKTTVSKNPGDFLYISAQNGDNNDCITVYIYKGRYGEEEWDKKNYSCGRFVIATLSDRL